MMRLGFPRANNRNNNNSDGSSSGTTASSIFSNITSTAMSITGSGNSIVHGSSAMERAAAAAAANAQQQQYTPGDGEDLPPGWRLVSSRATGRDYYLHLATNSTQWEKPTEAEPKKGVEQAVPHQRSGHATSVFTSGVSGMRAGLTSMFSQANTRLQTTLATNSSAAHSSSSSSLTAQAKLGSSQLRASQEIDREGQHLVEMFENERLDGKLQAQDPKRFSDKHAAPGAGYDALPDNDLPEGHEWVTEWEIDTNYTAVDRDGWTYAVDFVEIVRLLRDDLSHASRHPNDAVRRRRWIRYRQAADDASPASPRESSEAKSLGSSGTWPADGPLSETSYAYADESDDPFHRTAQKQQSGFRVNMKFPHRGAKDNTKDYQSINLTDVLWLVNAHDVPNAPTDELMREKTANLEEQIKDATARSVRLERELRAQHDTKSKDLVAQQKKFEALVAQYKKIKQENEALQISVTAHRATVDALRKEATEKDMLANDEQRALNAEMSAANQALEEKAKALATARMRYKRDNKSLAASLDAAKKRLEQHRAKANEDAQDPLAKDLKTEMEKVRQLHAKLEAVRQHRLAVEEESKALFNQVVEKKADLKFKSKKKMETALKDVDEKLQSLKAEQAELSKRLAQKPEGDDLRKLNARRNDIRSELGALKERRTMLLAEKRKQEGVEL